MRVFAAVAFGLTCLVSSAWAQGSGAVGPTTPPAPIAQPAPAVKAVDSVTLTPEQWACLKTRLANLKEQGGDSVRVPLSPCSEGDAATRSLTAVRPMTAPLAPTLPAGLALTKPPLYLTQAQLKCVDQRIGDLSAAQTPAASVSFADCKTK